MTDATAPLFSQADAARFLATHWQRAPLFLRAALGALPPAPKWRTLAASDEVESRRIVTFEDGRLRLTDGPVVGSDPAQPWTVLIQDADFHAPALRALFKAVDFLPAWRIEDIMMSVASAGGSVGPHVDAYDVFLVQAKGTRRWEIGRAGEYEHQPHGEGLRLVRPFDAAQVVEAEPGDVLYLPPDVPHHGVAQDDCITYSIGFRAPTLHELAAVVLEKLPTDKRYADPGLTLTTQPSRINGEAITRLREQLRTFASLDDALLAAALGEVMTETKPWLLPDEPQEHAELSKSVRLIAAPGIRLAIYDESGNAMLFANGHSYPLTTHGQITFADELALHRRTLCPDDEDCRALASTLFEAGIVEMINDD